MAKRKKEILGCGLARQGAWWQDDFVQVNAVKVTGSKAGRDYVWLLGWSFYPHLWLLWEDVREVVGSSWPS